MGALSGSGPFDGNWHPSRPAGLREREHVVGPGALVEVGGKKPARLVRQERIDADDVPP